MVELVTKYQQYEEYKDSGVEWLGEIPSHWEVIPIKHLAILNPKKSTLSQDLMSDECSFVPMEKLKFNSLILDEKKAIKDVYDGYTYFENEDILVAKVTPCFENNNTTIAKDLINGVGFGSSEIFVLRVNNKVNNRYLFYRLLETIFLSVATAAMTGAGGLRRVPAETINTYPIAVPNVDEQALIANFLDFETAQIDILIDKQQTLISLLKEKRQAVISHAVTKGLNPDAPMKNSGVEWLGEVPKHWVVATLRRVISSMEQGKSPQCESSPAKLDEWGVLKTSCVNGGRFNEEENKLLPSHIAPHEEYEVQAGDLLMSRASGSINLIGSVVLVQEDVRTKLLLSDKVFRIYLSENYDSLFFTYLMSSSYMRSSIEIAISGAEGMANNIAKSSIMEFVIPIFPIDEQVEIAGYIKTIESKYSSLISKAEQAIQLMQERRTALISAAVTGKIDVRGWVAPEVKV